MELKCFKCGEVIQISGTVSRHDECPKCRSDIRSCCNCDFYEPKVYNECRETQADRILEKERANHCDYFRPNTGGAAHMDETQKALSAAEALFKGLKKS